VGASSWYYFAPYQKDVSQVLQELRQAVFAKGEYFSLWMFLKSIIEEGKDSYIQWAGGPSEMAEELFNGLEKEWEHVSKTPPQTIDDVLVFNETNRTHTILDIEKVSSSPQVGTFSPFEGKAQLTLFGTERPIIAQIEAVLDVERLWNIFPRRGYGRYCVVYQNNTPHEIFFAGVSGD